MTREEAIRRMEFCRNFLANNYSDMGEPNVTAFNMAIKALEQEPKTEWIPARERLPENFQRVLVTIVNYNGNKVVRVAEYYSWKGKGVFQIKENHEQWEVGEKGLLAWRPLPEPYKAGGEEK